MRESLFCNFMCAVCAVARVPVSPSPEYLLTSRSGSLTNLAKYPASTVQILGAEKALFRALKTKGNTPKVCTPCSRLLRPSFSASARARTDETVRSHLPLDIHRTCRTQAQGPYLPFPRQQVFDRLQNRLFLGCPDDQVWRGTPCAGRGATSILRGQPLSSSL